MAPAKSLILGGATLIVAAVVVAVFLLSAHLGMAAEVPFRLDIVALIVGVILSVTGVVFNDMRKLFWENARAMVRKAGRDDKHAA